MRVLVFGTFDRFHPGHDYLLSQAQKRGELFVVVARDETTALIKGRKPDQTQEERMEAIKTQFPHAHLLSGDTEDYLKPVWETKPDLILLGYDQNLPPGITMEDLPCPVERVAAFEPEMYKTSKIRKARE